MNIRIKPVQLLKIKFNIQKGQVYLLKNQSLYVVVRNDTDNLYGLLKLDSVELTLFHEGYWHKDFDAFLNHHEAKLIGEIELKK